MGAAIDPFHPFVRMIERYRHDVHELYPEGSAEALAVGSKTVGAAIPPTLHRFLSRWNGAVLFRGALRIRRPPSWLLHRSRPPTSSSSRTDLPPPIIGRSSYSETTGPCLAAGKQRRSGSSPCTRGLIAGSPVRSRSSTKVYVAKTSFSMPDWMWIHSLRGWPSPMLGVRWHRIAGPGHGRCWSGQPSRTLI